jgi:predicted hydrocarbon binding protein
MFVELSRFIEGQLGSGEWEKALTKAGLSGRSYDPRSPGPDAEFMALVSNAADASGEPEQSLLEAFGEFLAPDLLGGLYGLLVAPDWDLLDFLEHTEEAIHMVVRTRDPAAKPPRLRIARVGPDEISISYDSPRRLCSVAKGIIRGAATHFRERIELQEPRCMLTGGSRCEISVRRSRE